MINFTNPVAFVDPQGQAVTLKADPATVPAWATFSDQGNGFYNIQGTAPATGGPWSIEITACDTDGNESEVHTLTITCEDVGGPSTGTIFNPNPIECSQSGAETICPFINSDTGNLSCNNSNLSGGGIFCSQEPPEQYSLNLSGTGINNIASLSFSSSCGLPTTIAGPFTGFNTITQAVFNAIRNHLECVGGYSVTMECS